MERIFSQPKTNNGQMPARRYQLEAKPSCQIRKSISFQKFRQEGENRPGIKNQRNHFMTLQLNNMQGKDVEVIIVCIDADIENMLQIHPNGLAGKDCQEGIYKNNLKINNSQHNFSIEVPYLHIERKKTRKSNIQENNQVLLKRTEFLPSPWKERFKGQCNETLWTNKIDKTKVRLAVFVTVTSSPGLLDKPLIVVSDIIKNGGQNTSLSIQKISNFAVPASTGAPIDIFTTEKGPLLEPEKYRMYVTYTSDGTKQKLANWESDEQWLNESSLLYKKVITYQVPAFEPNPYLTTAVVALLHLECPESNLKCTTQFLYVPSGGVMDVTCQNGYATLADMDLDASSCSKKLKLAENEEDAMTASLMTNVKMKPYKYQGDVSGYMTQGKQIQQSPQGRQIQQSPQGRQIQQSPQGRQIQQSPKGRQSVGNIFHQKSQQFLQATSMDTSESLVPKLEDSVSDFKVDTTTKNKWFPSTTALNSKQGYQDSNLSQSGVYIKQDTPLTFDSLPDCILDQRDIVYSLKRKAPLNTNFQQMTAIYQDPVSVANISYNTHINKQDNIEMNGIQDVQTEYWCNQISSNENQKNNLPGCKQNTVLDNYSPSCGETWDNIPTNADDQILNIPGADLLPDRLSSLDFDMVRNDFDVEAFTTQFGW